jgi:hypothetical protein
MLNNYLHHANKSHPPVNVTTVISNTTMVTFTLATNTA